MEKVEGESASHLWRLNARIHKANILIFWRLFLAKPFFETTRSLKADGYRGAYLTLIVVTILSVGWSWWFTQGAVATWEVTSQATLEVNGKVYRIDSPLDGKVEQQFLDVEKPVKKGDVLLVLESGRLRLSLAEEQAQFESYEAQLAAAQAQGEANMLALQRAVTEAENLVAKTTSELRTAEANTSVRRDVAERYARLAKEEMVSQIDNLDARAKLDQAKGAENALALSLKLHRSQKKTAVQQLAVARTEMEERTTLLHGSINKSREIIKRLQLEISERTIRAPISGTLGEVAAIQQGRYVAQGFGVCTIVPDGEPRVFAHFNPGVALGRIRTGQEARVRLQGFPWTQFGSLTARVSKVGGEPRDGLVQVDLELVGETPAHIPLQHGMPGTVEVKIDSLSPWSMILRSIGVRMQGGAEASP